MEENELITCSSCGARISKESDQCGLCGWPIGQSDHDMQAEARRPAEKKAAKTSKSEKTPAQGAEPATLSDGPFCHMCGWKNPAGARFCSACGTPLQVTAPVKQANLSKKTKKKPAAPLLNVVPEEDLEVTPADLRQAEPDQQEPRAIQPLHIGMLAVAGLLVVAVLYMITTFSWRAFPEVEPAPAQAQSNTESSGQSSAQSSASQATSLSASVASRIAALEAEAEGLEGEGLILKKREIVSILSSESRPDKAAPVQEEIATLTNTRADWFQAGHFFYDWMDTLAGEQRFGVASKAVSAYEKGLALGADDLNVRTALAMAYMNTRAPMQGVQQIRQVLETDPDHLQGNFYYGVMLMQINRTDQAKAQFTRVKELVGPESPLYKQADMMLQNLN